jgi:uncharacterized protein (DUF486 family)
MRLSLTVVLLLVSNVFMTVAWYGHLRFMTLPLWRVVLVSWSVALLEYCFQVPANRIGYAALSAYQLETLQEAITPIVFVGSQLCISVKTFYQNISSAFYSSHWQSGLSFNLRMG